MAIPQILWFKRDLRLDDHAALTAAAARGPVLPLYVVEPGYWAQPDTSHRQYRFQIGSARDLADQISAAGGRLRVEVGELTDVLARLHRDIGPFELHAHEETGNRWTHLRDKQVRRWARQNGVRFHEYRQFGVWRGPGLNRDKWASAWDWMMGQAQLAVPAIDWIRGPAPHFPTPEELGLTDDGLQTLQHPTRAAALSTLQSFLYERGAPYRAAMSSPLAGETACSRLSTYLSSGLLSMREVYQAAEARAAELKSLPPGDREPWAGSIKSFLARLHWHCHFIQKLEAEPDLEWRPAHKAYEHLRGPSDPDRLAAFEAGRTGYPFVDACLRYCRATGWLNFRMRAMLMSFATYDLWLRWQDAGLVLGRWFTDYEPGIHWPQCQMQAGETGINTIRIYSPVKQGKDQDPEGTFTRRWVPELAALDAKAIHEPWKHGRAPDYPSPIVDHAKATKAAKEKIWAIRQTPAARAEANAVYQRHGSRRRLPPRAGKGDMPPRRAKRRAVKSTDASPVQGTLDV